MAALTSTSHVTVSLSFFYPPPALRTLRAALASAAAIARRSRRRLLHARSLLGGKLRTRRHALQPRDLIAKLTILGLEPFVLASQLITTIYQCSNNTSKVEIAFFLVKPAARSHPKRESKFDRSVQPIAREFAPLALPTVSNRAIIFLSDDRCGRRQLDIDRFKAGRLEPTSISRRSYATGIDNFFK